MKNNFYLKTALFITSLLILLNIINNLAKNTSPMQKINRLNIPFDVEREKIKNSIQNGILSEKEAMFFENLDLKKSD